MPEKKKKIKLLEPSRVKSLEFLYLSNPEKELDAAKVGVAKAKKRYDKGVSAQKWFGKGKGILGIHGVSDAELKSRQNDVDSASKHLDRVQQYISRSK
jgi:hypothetical protein